METTKRKAGRPKKVVDTKNIALVIPQDLIRSVDSIDKLPITVSLKLAGQDQLIDTDNVLKYFRELSIDRLRIKSRAQFTFTHNGKEFYKVLTIPQIKRFIGNDDYKKILAKWVNSNLGIKNG